MADAPQTLAEWAAHGGTNPLAKMVLNTLVGKYPMLGIVPMLRWPGGEDYSWVLNKTAPTFTWEAETATHESTQAKRRKLRTYLSYGHGEVEIPIASSNMMDEALNQEREDVMDLIRSAGLSIGAKIFTGTWMTPANVTIAGTGLAATPGFDSITAVSQNMPAGLGGLFYDHSETALQFKAPGSTTYGTAVDISGGDGSFTLTDGDDSTMSITGTVDITDFTTGAVDITMPGAFLFQKPESPAGLRYLATLDTTRVFGASTDGDAPTLAHLDELDDAVEGPSNEKVFVMNTRTRRYYKSLLGGGGGVVPEYWMGTALAKNSLFYEGKPILADANVSIAETQGQTTTCGRVYCVRLNPQQGVHMYYGDQNGPNVGTMAAVTDTDEILGNAQLPVYLRKLGEGYTAQNYKWRLSANVATVLRKSSGVAVRYGLTY